MAFLAQKLIYTINMWFYFLSGSFFEQDHLINLTILGTYMGTYFKIETDVAKNLIGYFFLTLTVGRPFHREDFKWMG